MHFNVGNLRYFKVSIILDQIMIVSKVYTIRLERYSFLELEFVAKTQFLCPTFQLSNVKIFEMFYIFANNLKSLTYFIVCDEVVLNI